MKTLLISGFSVCALVLVACSGTPSPDPRDAGIAAALAGIVKDHYTTDDWYSMLRQVNDLPKIQVNVNGCGDAVPPCGSAVIFTNVASSTEGQALAGTICSDVSAVVHDPDMAPFLYPQNFEVDGGSGHDKLATCEALP
jgi:hypothetical protein